MMPKSAKGHVMVFAHKRPLLDAFPRLAWATCLALSVMAGGCASLPRMDSRPLYQQLGGTEALTRITDRTMDRVSTDPRTRRTFDGVKMSTLKASVASYVCKVADGPCTYEGETMARSHADLGITGAEFDLMVSMLRDELNAAGVSEGAKNELLKRLAPSRRDIVKR
jgi:hemoglobin